MYGRTEIANNIDKYVRDMNTRPSVESGSHCIFIYQVLANAGYLRSQILQVY